MACETQKFPNVSPTVWACLKKAAAAQGYTITTDSGQQSGSGFTIAWDYNATAQTLEVTCTANPGWAPCSLVNSKIQQLAKDSGCLST